MLLSHCTGNVWLKAGERSRNKDLLLVSVSSDARQGTLLLLVATVVFRASFAENNTFQRGDRIRTVVAARMLFEDRVGT